MSRISLAAGGGTIWKLPLMLLAGGGFIAAVVSVVFFLWHDSQSASPLLLPLTVTPTATPAATDVASATATPLGPPVLTPAVAPLPEETITPSPSATASPTPVVTATHTPTPSPSLTSSPTPTVTPTPSPTPSPTAVPGPGGIQGSVICQGQAVDGAQVTVSGSFPQGGQVWSGVTGGDGTFSTGFILGTGSYVIAIISPGASYDSMPVTVAAGSYVSVLAQCTLVYGPGY